MISIGDFARLGRVSVRMLRHYDEIDLLRPARVDSLTGYRYYEIAQLSQLNRILALKGLGFTLQQVQALLNEGTSVAKLKHMLQDRRAALESQIRADQERLSRVQARISIIERENTMHTNEIIVKRIPSIRVAEMRAIATSYEPESIAPVVSPLFDELCGRLIAAGVTPVGPTIAYYEPAEDGVLVHAACPVDPKVRPTHLGEDIHFVELPEIEAATLVHHGSMDNADLITQELARWIESNGFHGTGYAREVYLEARGPRETWVTEFQEPIAKDPIR